MKRLIRLTHITILSVASLAVDLAVVQREAHALQGGEDPALLPVLVDKRYGSKHLHQLSLNFSTAMASKFVEATGVYATYGYNFTDLLGVEVGGGFFAGRESSIMAEVRQNFPGQEPPLTDLYQLNWAVQADVVLVPLYGKMSLASEINPSYDLFILGGGGIAGLKRQIGESALGQSEKKISPMFNFGVGFRFYIVRWLGIRLELRDVFYPEGDSDPNKTGLTHNLLFQGGVQFILGGDK